MVSAILCALAFAICLLAGRQSLVTGLVPLLAIGYAYGIVRANVYEPLAHFTFDAGVCGFYLARLLAPSAPLPTHNAAALRLWLIVFAGWLAIVFAFPFQDPLVRLVGLRSSIFLLPFMLFGARLTASDTRRLAWVLALLNILEFAIAGTEFIVGIDRFFPRNEVTRLIYASNDLVSFSAYRIPASFANAHAYGGTMVVTLPWLLGAWTWREVRPNEKRFLGIAIGLSCLGVFMSASRSHAAVMFIVLSAFVIFGGVRQGILTAVLALLAGIAWVVSNDERLSRFTTLQDLEYVLERIHWSVNGSLFDLALQYPLGNGLGGGGTSIPYFLQDHLRESAVVESEYGRMTLELGVPGLLLWFFLLGWAYTRRLPQGRSSWHLARRVAWFCTAAYFVTGWIGTGLLTSIPQSLIFLMVFGWAIGAEAPDSVSSRESSRPGATSGEPNEHATRWPPYDKHRVREQTGGGSAQRRPDCGTGRGPRA